MINLDPNRGHEQAGRRPALIVSVDLFNAGPAGLVIVLPVTSKAKGVRSHVAVQLPEGGLQKPNYVKCEDVRSVAVEQLNKRLGVVSSATMEAVAMRLRILMDL